MHETRWKEALCHFRGWSLQPARCSAPPSREHRAARRITQLHKGRCAKWQEPGLRPDPAALQIIGSFPLSLMGFGSASKDVVNLVILESSSAQNQLLPTSPLPCVFWRKEVCKPWVETSLSEGHHLLLQLTRAHWQPQLQQAGTALCSQHTPHKSREVKCPCLESPKLSLSARSTANRFVIQGHLFQSNSQSGFPSLEQKKPN